MLLHHLSRAFWILLAVVFLIEAWLWEHIRPLVAWVVARLAWTALRERIAAAIRALPPYPTLLVFLIPLLLLLPLKFLGLWMLSHGSWLGALAVLGFAKVMSVGVTAFIFDLTRPTLLQLAWFRRLYDLIMRTLAWAHALIDPVKEEVRAYARRHLRPVQRRLRRLARRARTVVPARSGSFLRHLARLRRRMQRRGASAATE